jgi:hypothetical protein
VAVICFLTCSFSKNVQKAKFSYLILISEETLRARTILKTRLCSADKNLLKSIRNKLVRISCCTVMQKGRSGNFESGPSPEFMPLYFNAR